MTDIRKATEQSIGAVRTGRVTPDEISGMVLPASPEIRMMRELYDAQELLLTTTDSLLDLIDVYEAEHESAEEGFLDFPDGCDDTEKKAMLWCKNWDATKKAKAAFIAKLEDKT